MVLSCLTLLRMRNVGKIEAHTLCSTTFPEIRAVYEIMGKKKVKRRQATQAAQ